MTGSDALWWDTRVQPYIATAPSTRADRLWAWSVMLPGLLLQQLSKGRRCRPLVIWSARDDGGFVRSAMTFIIEDYPHLDVRQPGPAHFVWFLSVAPDNVLQRLGVSAPARLGPIALDSAMVLSSNAGFGGRIGLHAAPAGGSRLLDYYQRQCGLLALPQTVSLPQSIRKRNDGRFFYADDPTAAQLLRFWSAFR